MLENKADYRAMIQFFAVTTSAESFCLNTFSDLTIIVAIGEFCPLNTATRAIYGFRGDLRRVVHSAPFLSGFFS